MCGICGIAYRDDQRSPDVETLAKMAGSIRHRGPDEEGHAISGPVGLAMRRLSIIDVEGGHQPISNERRGVHAVCNGEIYNYRELSEDLRRRGHELRSRCDVEVIPHAYEDDRRQFVQRLRGMFALAVWDEEARELTLAVDRLGIKPLYYAATPDGLVFGSELKCVLASGMVKVEVDLDGLAEYFSLGFIPAPATAIRSVRKLGAGELLTWTAAAGARVESYWDLPSPSVSENGSADTAAAVREQLREAVESHLVSDVPLGAFLSGGIDSSAVVALMTELGAGPVKTFSIGFPDERYSELGRARIVAEHFGTDHHELVVEPDSIATLPEIAAYFDEPFADTSALPTYRVSKLARESVKVALSGDGGDELFVGYPLFRSLELARRAERLPAGARGALDSTLRRAGEARGGQVGVWSKRLADTLAPPAAAYRRKMAAPGLHAVGPVLADDFRAELRRRSPFRAIDAALEHRRPRPGDHPLDRFLYTAARVTLPADMLVKVDRMSMANSLEVRVPLLDNVFVESVTRIPVERRFRGWKLKRLLKEAVSDLLPAEILNQPKTGFNVPLNAWFKGDAAAFAHETVRDGWAASNGLIDRAAAERNLARPGEGASLSKSAWSLLMFELWCSTYLAAN